MITKFKIYEELNVDEPEIGDYVIGYSDDFLVDINEFTKNNIGIFVEILIPKYTENDTYPYMVAYDNIPTELNFYVNKIYDKEAIAMQKKDIKYWSKDKEDLEKILMANKFNL